MKVFAVCMQCQIDRQGPSFEPFMVDYYDDGTSFIECAAGHKTAQLSQSQKFEMLMNSGALALLQGFTLEACISFAVALERFFEFALRVISTGKGMPTELFNAMFLGISKQSERQMGAFLYLHAQEFDVEYKIKTRIVEMRNSIVHKGTIPNSAEAHKFCTDVYREIYNLFNAISTKYSAAVHTCIMRDVAQRRDRLPVELRVSTAVELGIFSIIRQNPSSFSEALASYEAQIRTLKAAIPYMRELHAALQQKISEDPHDT